MKLYYLLAIIAFSTIIMSATCDDDIPPIEICNNNIDDDLDGFTDLDDPDCTETDEECSNGIDDDADGDIDCDDSDCAGAQGC